MKDNGTEVVSAEIHRVTKSRRLLSQTEAPRDAASTLARLIEQTIQFLGFPSNHLLGCPDLAKGQMSQKQGPERGSKPTP